MTSGDSPPTVGARALLAALIAVAVLYTAHRAVTLRVEYYDGYEYLMNARAALRDPVASYNLLRPAFVTMVQLPAVAVGRASPPAAEIRIVAPHVTAALCSLAAAAAVFWLLRRSFGTTLGLLGVLLFVSSRYFIRYGAHVMSDLPAAGWAAAALGLHARARERRTWGAWVALGVALAMAALSKFPAALLGPALAVSEVWLAARARKVDRGLALGIVAAGMVAAVAFLAINFAVFAGVYRGEALAKLYETFQPRGVADLMSMSGGSATESWRDYGPMLLAMLSAPVLGLALVGLATACWQRSERDLPVLAWLVFAVAPFVLLVRHNEARYLLPAVPAVLYFALRGVERVAGLLAARWPGLSRSSRLAALAVAIALLAGALRVGVAQAGHDRDSMFTADQERRVSSMAHAARKDGGRLLWYGQWQTFHPRRPLRIPGDEFFDTFHFAPFALAYFTGHVPETFSPRRGDTDMASFATAFADRDVVVRVPDAFYDMTTLPAAGVPPPEIWSVRRTALTRVGGDELMAATDRQLRVRLGERDGRLTLRPTLGVGAWSVVATTKSPPSPRLLGETVLRADEEALLAPGSADDVESLILLRIDRRQVTVD